MILPRRGREAGSCEPDPCLGGVLFLLITLGAFLSRRGSLRRVGPRHNSAAPRKGFVSLLRCDSPFVEWPNLFPVLSLLWLRQERAICGKSWGDVSPVLLDRLQRMRVASQISAGSCRQLYSVSAWTRKRLPVLCEPTAFGYYNTVVGECAAYRLRSSRPSPLFCLALLGGVVTGCKPGTTSCTSVGGKSGSAASR